MPVKELRVAQIQDYTPKMRRVIFDGPGVAQYATHPPCVPNIKIYFPHPGQQLDHPGVDERGRWAFRGDQRSRVRTYTVRWLDHEKGQMAIDFVRHGDEGLASAWVERIIPGDILGALGGGGRVLEPGGYAVLLGDETALPAISDALEQMPANQEGQVFIEVADHHEIHDLRKPSGVQVTWLLRSGKSAGTTQLLPQAMRNLQLPVGREFGHVRLWVSAESQVVRFARTWAAQAGIPKQNRLIIGYWHKDMDEVAYAKDSDHDRVANEMLYERAGHEREMRHEHSHH